VQSTDSSAATVPPVSTNPGTPPGGAIGLGEDPSVVPHQGSTTGGARRLPASDVAMYLLPLVVLLVLAGVWSHSPGLAILVGVLVLPPLLITCLKSVARASQARGNGSLAAEHGAGSLIAPRAARMTAEEKVSTFANWLLVMLATVGGIAGLAAICVLIALASMMIALLKICGVKL